jgi:hypothetical protein
MIYRSAGPDLPDDPDPPDTETRGELQPPGRVPPLAVATYADPGDSEPYFPSAYPRRLSATARIGRVFFVAVLVVCGTLLDARGMDGRALWALLALPCFLAGYAAITGEGIERSIYRRFRWLRRRYHRYRAAHRRPTPQPAHAA